MNALQNALGNPFPALRTRSVPRSAATVLRLLGGLAHGALDVRLPDGQHCRFGDGTPCAHLEIGDWSVFDAVLARGDVGFAEAWIDVDWHSADPVALLTLLAANREALGRAVYGQWLGLLGARLRHLFNANTRGGSRRNIMAHYDLGNDFYRQWLDPTMSYSSALYADDPAGGARPLAAAQLAKYRRILRRLDVQPGQRILEIGCGWGGFAEVAAREAGALVHGLTLSPAQLEFARDRMQRAGLSGQVRLDLCDYRDLVAEPFDHIVSIEMFEAVGERWWPTYFAKVAGALKPGGKAVVQSITIADDLFADYRKGTDFIQQYIFPGGMLPSRAAFRAAAARQGLTVSDEFAFGRDYARTLAEWRQAFEDNWPAIRQQGFDERFRRLWRFYLAYCEAGFLAGNIDVVQFELAHAPA